MRSKRAAREYGNFIDGEWHPAETGHTFDSRDPATDALAGRFHASVAADAAAAIRAARDAFPAWRATPAPKRGEIMYRFGALMAEHKERLSRAMTPRWARCWPRRAATSRKASTSPS